MKQEIIEAIAKDFSLGCRKSKKLVSLYKKMAAGKATYLDADQYALETAQVLGSTLHKHLGVETISGAEYKEIISSVLPEGLHGIHESVATYAQTIQNGINKRAGLGVQAVKAQFEPEKAREIVTKAVSVETFTEAEGAVKVDTMNFAQNAATKTMKDNAQLSEDLGYEVTVDRTYDDVGVHEHHPRVVGETREAHPHADEACIRQPLLRAVPSCVEAGDARPDQAGLHPGGQGIRVDGGLHNRRKGAAAALLGLS